MAAPFLFAIKKVTASDNSLFDLSCAVTCFFFYSMDWLFGQDI